MRATMLRSRHDQKRYDEYRNNKQGDDCDFCIMIPETVYLETTRYFSVVRNNFPYRVWDSAFVTDCLMLVSQRHFVLLGDMTKAEQSEYLSLLAAYEAKGCTYYSRGKAMVTGSQLHFHTHLLQLGKRIRAAVFIDKPHIFVSR